jgi:hypothetical protein
MARLHCGIVPASAVAAHPWHSLNPRDYLGPSDQELAQADASVVLAESRLAATRRRVARVHAEAAERRGQYPNPTDKENP